MSDICCEKIIQAKADINNIGKKVTNLETLYKPVSRLSTLFVICIFVLSGMLALSGFMWKTIDSLKDEIVVSLSKNDVAHAEIKKDMGYLTRELRGLKKAVNK